METAEFFEEGEDFDLDVEDENDVNPDDIAFSWTEMILLSLIVIPADLVSLGLILTGAGAILAWIINAFATTVVLFWIYFIKSGGQSMAAKKMLIKRFAMRWGVASALGLAGIPAQSVALLWMFAEAKSEAVKFATQLAERRFHISVEQ